MSSAPSVPGIEVGAPWLGGCEHVLTAGTLELLATLHPTFGPRRTELPESRTVRDAELAGGRCPDSWPGTKDMRQGDGQVAPLAQFKPEDLDTMQPGCCALGPGNLVNPGKVVPTPRPCGEGPSPRTAAGDTRDPAIGQVFFMPVLTGETRPGTEADVAPAQVLRQVSAEEVVVLHAAGAERATVVPVGAGTQTGWAAPPTSCDIVLDTTGRVVGHPAGDLVVVTEAVVRLQAPVGQPGQVLALDPPEGVRDQPGRLLHNLLHPEPARELAERKTSADLATGAPPMVTANPGCWMQVARRWRGWASRCPSRTSCRYSTHRSKPCRSDAPSLTRWTAPARRSGPAPGRRSDPLAPFRKEHVHARRLPAGL